MNDKFVMIVPDMAGDRSCSQSFEQSLAGAGAEPRAFGSVLLYLQKETRWSVHDRAGVGFFGALFRRRDNSPVDRLEAGEAYTIGASRGEHLIKAFWGCYVGMILDPGGKGVRIVRDPSGSQPVYWMRQPGFHLIFSDLAMIMASGIVLPSFDWTGIAHHVRFPFLRTAITGLTGISEILPGQSVHFGDGAPRFNQLWSPWSFTQAKASSFSESSEQLASTISATLSALASQFANVRLELSGGLDSSIIASCLSYRSGPWSSVTFATEAADGDERHYARAVAARVNCPLEEITLTASDADPVQQPLLPRVRPASYSVLASSDRKLLASARAAGAGAIFSGAGGDNTFCTITSAAPVVDAWRQSGLRSAMTALHDVAILNETTTWDAMGHAGRQFRRGRAGRSPWATDDRCLGDQGRIAFAGHPWLEMSDSSLPGKIAHVASLLRVFPFLDAYDRAFAMPMLCPLMAQPIMEACLAIPSWQWIAGGRDRAVARQAFARRIPPQVRYRRTKGGLESVFLPAFERNRAALRELLLGGQLAAKGIIDCARIEAEIDAPISMRDGKYTRILEIADVELWIRSIDGFRAAR